MLKGEAKKTYQREYMRGYMRDLRLKQRLLRPSTSKSVKTPLEPGLEWIEGGEYRRVNAIGQVIDADGNAIYEEG